jgi:hypothetical protein
MKQKLRYSRYTVPMALVAAFAPAVHAGCGDTSNLQPPFVFTNSVQVSNRQAVLQRASSAAKALAEGGSATINTATIVGMWNIQFLSLGNTTHNPSIPDGAQIDFGYTQWHSDGTELMNSGGHTPVTGNWCMGTWVRSGYFSYELNHWALSYDATSQVLTTKVNILQQVTLDPSGNEFTGTFTITVFNATTGVQVDRLTGTLAGQRVTVDQTTP